MVISSVREFVKILVTMDITEMTQHLFVQFVTEIVNYAQVN
jgi:hypothetical protein